MPRELKLEFEIEGIWCSRCEKKIRRGFFTRLDTTEAQSFLSAHITHPLDLTLEVRVVTPGDYYGAELGIKWVP